MPTKLFDRNELKTCPLSKRISKIHISSMIHPNTKPKQLDEKTRKDVEIIAHAVRKAKNNRSPIILATGAHLIKNGGSRILIELMNQAYISHIIMNSAGSIHDWELAYQGMTAEDVKEYITAGQFGIWEETGKFINLAINSGAKNNLGYGVSIGKMILEDKVRDQYGKVIEVKHGYPEVSLQAQAYKLNILLGVLASIGQDIIYCSPYNDGAAIGATSLNDFLSFANTVRNLEHGVYLSIGSSIMSPMAFEKALSMARNTNKERKPKEFLIVANDIQPKLTMWEKGEPPIANPEYYNRIFKTFSRMGGDFKYVELDNIDFIHNLYTLLKQDI